MTTGLRSVEKEPAVPTSAADLALAAYIEPFAARKRVLLIGDPNGPAAARLATTAAQIEVVPSGMKTRASRGSKLAVRGMPAASEVFDLVFVPDASAFLAEPGRLREVAEGLDARGVALFAVEAGSVEYEAFHESLTQHFASIRMLGQTDFSGFAVVDFAGARGRVDVTFDDTVLSGETEKPFRFLAICGAREPALEPYVVVQVPREELATDDIAAPVVAVEVETVRSERDALRSRLEHAEKRLEQAQKDMTRNGHRLDSARADIERLTAEVAAGARGTEDAVRAAREQAIADARVELETAREDSADQEEFEALEEALRERGRENGELRVELERRALLVRDVVEALADARRDATSSEQADPRRAAVAAAASGAEERERLEGLVRTAQRRAIDAEAARAAAVFGRDEVAEKLRLAELERTALESRIAALGTQSTRPPVTPAPGAEQLAESTRALDALRRDHADELATLRGAAEREAAQVEREREQYAVERAFLQGRIRGLLARGAEIDELRQLAEARLELRQADLDTLNKRTLDLEREGELTKERLELSIAREHSRVEMLVPAELELQAAEQRARDARDRERALRREIDEEREGYRGELSGLRMRAAESDTALALAQAHANELESRLATVSGTARSADGLSKERDELSARTVELERRLGDEKKRTSQLSSRLLAFDQLASRLQAAVAREADRTHAIERARLAAESRVVEARDVIAGLEAVQAVRYEEESREREAGERRVEAAQRDADDAGALKDRALAALRDTRALLAAIGTPVEGDASESEPRKGGREHDVMLRSLIAQVEERDDRIRQLERQLTTPTSTSSGREDVLRLALRDAEGREEKLLRELEESKARSPEAAAHAEIRRLEEQIEGREQQLMELEDRLSANEREARGMRDSFADARKSVEVILQQMGVSDARAEDITELLRVLRRH